MRSHSHVLDLARDGLIKKVFWPSSIAVFGPNTPKKIHHNIQSWSLTLFMESQNLPVKDGTNIIQKNLRSISEVLDILDLIGWKGKAGGGTTDYAVDIFHHAVINKDFTCFLSKDTQLPMMYMADAIKATIQMMESPEKNIKIKSSYNIAGISFSPKKFLMKLLNLSRTLKLYIVLTLDKKSQTHGLIQ